MLECRMRTVVIDGRRRGVRLDTTTWAAIDHIAAKQKRKWGKWALEYIDQYPDTNNITAVIREAALIELLKEVNERNETKEKIIAKMQMLSAELET